MAVRAFWNVYIPPGKIEEWEYPAMELRSNINVLADIEGLTDGYQTNLTRSLYNNGENLELILEGNIYRLVRFLHQYSREVSNPHLITTDTEIELAVLSEEIEVRNSKNPIDMEIQPPTEEEKHGMGETSG